ncbi:MAG: DUF2189 domain-containing protein [Mangrovicoccus sp.]|nr:DUF2189 domain-containing protein [Mangrovicoccus sp.]
MVHTIGNPLSWSAQAVGSASSHLAQSAERIGTRADSPPQIRDLSTEDLWHALIRGFEDFMALRSDVIFICVLYPIIGLCLTLFAFNAALAPYLFPLASGFALIGPIAAIGLYEMSRRREAGETPSWSDGLLVLKSPAMGPILLMGLYLLAIFALWMLTAGLIYQLTMGPEAPASVLGFFRDAFATPEGRLMILLGLPVGAVFAGVVLAISVVSIPLMLDRQISLPEAVVTSLRVCRQNPMVIAAWGLIVAALLVLGSLPLFLGLIVVMPLLGHASWHLYRRAVLPEN